MRLLSCALLVLLTATSGCATYVYDRGYDPDYYRDRIVPDVERYVELLDRDLDLSRTEARRIERMLVSRARHLLSHTPERGHHRVYPFPRGDRFHDRAYGRYEAARRDWWRDADRHIGRILPERQGDRYYDLVRDGRFDDRDDYEEDRDDRRRGRHSR